MTAINRKEAQAMRRVAPSTLVREEIDRLLSAGTDPGTNILSALAELGLRFVAQQALEQEQADHLGRDRYERTGEDHHRGWRNGYEDARLSTGEGAVPVRVPQTRGGEEPYRSRLMEFLSGNSEVLERLVTEMYARGLSTRDVEDCFRDATGELLSHEARSQRSPIGCGRSTRHSAPATCRGSSASTCSWTPCTSPFAATGPRRACSRPGASPQMAGRSCCTWRWGTRSPRPAGPSSCGTWSAEASGSRPRSPVTGRPGSSTPSARSSPRASGSAAGTTGWPTSAPSSRRRRPRRCSPTSGRSGT